MIYLASIFNAMAFFGISLIHVYWALGGKWGISVAIPKVRPHSQQKAFSPGFFMTILVATVFAAWGCLTLHSIGYCTFLDSWIPPQYFNILSTIVAIILGLRAIGEFRYVGFFKKIKDTDFAFYDTRFYAPLCFILSIFQFFIAFNPF